MLSIFEYGSLSIGVSGLPLIRLDAESRSIDIEARGIKECGVKLSNLIAEENIGDLKDERRKNKVGELLRNSEATASTLSKMGWSLSLYDGGDRLLTMGRGVSRLTGYVHFSPLKLRRIFDALF